MKRTSATYVFLSALVLAALSRPAYGAGLPAADSAAGGDVLCIRALQNDSVVCAGTAGNGLYRSIDGGVAWTQTNIREGAAYVVLPDLRNASHLYAGTSLGLLASIDGGKVWWTMDTVLRPVALAATPSGPRLLFAADGSTVRRTDDDGKTWTTVEALSRYRIRYLTSARTDSGAMFFGANDTTVLVSAEKFTGIWSELPALPRAGTRQPRITSLLYDSLSLGGSRLLAGTSEGVYAFVFRSAQWMRFQWGLPVGPIGALGIIIYDTTTATRSYSYCAAIGRLPQDPPARRGVFKASSVAGVIAAGTAWIQIADEQIDVRAASMPDRGPNHGKIYLATADGIRVSTDDGTTWTRKILDVFPIASVTAAPTNAGMVGTNGTTTTYIRIGNRGGKTLVVDSLALGDTKNFSLGARLAPLLLQPQQSDSIPVLFHPGSIGKFNTVLSFTTNDPLLAHAATGLAGFCTGRGTAGRTIVIDGMHAGAEDVASRYSDLKRAFTMAGMSVIDSLPTSASAGAALVILPAPKRSFTPAECGVLAGLAARGATIAALGSAADGSATVLDTLFSQPQWKDAARMEASVRFRADAAAASRSTISAGRASAAASAAYLDHADTLAFTPGTALTVLGKNTDSLFTSGGGSLSGTTAGAEGTVLLASVTRMGKGKILAFGDPLFWANSPDGAMSTGLWAADNFACAFSVAGTIEDTPVALPDSTLDQQYRLFSVPFALADNSVTSAFANLGKPNPYDWRLFGRWNEAAQSYQEYPSPTFGTIDKGEAYWLITREPRLLALGTADYTVIPEPFTLRLKPGFTLIGDPFPFAIDWLQTQRPASVDDAIWEFDGKGFIKTLVMTPYAGYFVYNSSDSDAVVTLPPEPLKIFGLDKTAITAPSFAEGEWSMRVSATDGIAVDNENYIGMRRASSATAGANTFAEPPVPPGRYVALSFVENGCRDLAGDYRAIAQEGGVWECRVRSSEAHARVSLQFEAAASLPAGFSIYLLDRAAERVTDCTQALAYEFTFEANEASRAFRIIVGERHFIEQHTDGIPLTPLAYALEQNFPNPWNPTTTIRYTVAHSGMVELTVFNLLGQKVKTLVRAQQALGVYAEQWDGRDERGIDAASGVYFYRLTTPAFMQSKRMVLLR